MKLILLINKHQKLSNVTSLCEKMTSSSDLAYPGLVYRLQAIENRLTMLELNTMLKLNTLLKLFDPTKSIHQQLPQTSNPDEDLLGQSNLGSDIGDDQYQDPSSEIASVTDSETEFETEFETVPMDLD